MLGDIDIYVFWHVEYKMARMCDDIKGIDDTKETLKLGLSIISLCDCTNYDGKVSLS